MRLVKKPEAKPLRPQFSSGPCVKRPGWNLKKIVNDAYLGRSHRADGAKLQINRLINLTKSILEIPDCYKVALVPASNTGAFEMAMWNLLGALPVDIFAWENFGLTWGNDILNQLKISDSRLIRADYGCLPDMQEVRQRSDVCFTWNGTTSGVRVPNLNWITENREGLVLCDATSAVFAQEIEWTKLDAITFSWQKVMGGEGAHGMLILSPGAVERLKTYKVDRPLPKVFRLTKNGNLIEEIFHGETINTPSMLCVADALDALDWIQGIGGLTEIRTRANLNFKTLQGWLNQQHWVKNLVEIDAYRSNTSVCLKITDKEFLNLSDKRQRQFIKLFVSLLDTEKVAYDIGGHRQAPPGLRIWCGATVENQDLIDLLPWLNWAYETVMSQFFQM